MADGLAGQAEALRMLTNDPSLAAACVPHGIVPLLYERCYEAGISSPVTDGWRRSLMLSAGNWLLVMNALLSLADALGNEEIPWAPIKGVDTGTRLFARVEERPIADMDILISETDLDRARTSLEAAGWRGRDDTESATYVASEGYNWQAWDKSGVLLELHHRLWGFVGAEAPGDLWTRAFADPSLGPTAWRLHSAHVFMLGAIHAWLHPGPPRLIYWWELKLIGEDAKPDLVEGVVDTANRWGVQLPVALAAGYATELWDQPACGAIADKLMANLRWPERLAARHAGHAGMDSLTLNRIYLARLLSRRPSRMAWKAAWRRLWPHTATVSGSTPMSWPWWGRRAWIATRNLGFDWCAARLARVLDSRTPSPHDEDTVDG